MKRLSCILFSFLLMTASFAYAANFKVGVVNLDQVLLQSPLAISFNEKISKQFKPRQDELNAAQKNLQNELDQLTYNGFQMKTDARNALRSKINDDKRSFDSLNAALQQDLAAAQNKYTQELMKKLSSAINKIAKEGDFTIIQTN